MSYKITKLRAHVDILTGYPFKSKYYIQNPNDGIRIARGTNIKEGHFDWSSRVKYWNRFEDKKLENYFLESGDVLLPMDGSKVGKNFVQVRKEHLPLLLIQRVARIRAKNGLDQDFLYTIISSNRFEKYVDLIKTGTSIPHISKKQIQNYEFLLPPVKIQKCIIGILKSIRNKIELNTKMNETLEEMAQTIFKSWFVDFEPFQDGEFVESELGKIPKGWKVQLVSNLIDKKIIEKPKDGNHGSIHPKSNEYVESGIPFIMANDLEKGYINFDDCKYLTFDRAKQLKKGFSYEGDILLSHKGTVGRTAIVPKLNTPYIMLSPQVTHYRVIDSTNFSNLFLYNYFNSQHFQSLFSSWAQKGSTRLYLGITDQQNLPIIFPKKEYIKKFHKNVYPFFKKFMMNNQQNRLLTKLRNLLLPQLISGKIRISNPEKFLEEINNVSN